MSYSGQLFCPDAGGHDAGWFKDSRTFYEAQLRAAVLIKRAMEIASA
jgi:hypothetical protein